MNKFLLIIIMFYASFSFSQTFYVTPLTSDESIQIALKQFKIEVPENVTVRYAGFKENVRGHTIENEKNGQNKTVLIYDLAFSSWAVLGSTLAHEIEVHVKQDFSYIRKKNAVFKNNYGQNRAEVEAYQYELDNSERFSLNNEEKENIENLLDEYREKL